MWVSKVWGFFGELLLFICICLSRFMWVLKICLFKKVEVVWCIMGLNDMSRVGV